MSLRVRLNLLITSLFLVIFIGGSFYVIRNARDNVHEEINSTAHLTLQLIEIAIRSDQGNNENTQGRIIEKISNLGETRHLQISIRNPLEGYSSRISKKDRPIIKAPIWFIKLVEPPPLVIKRWLSGPNLPVTELIIRADPSDEISEAWIETRGVLELLLVFIVLTNLVLYLTIGRYLAPIESILEGLDEIEQGNYKLRLPRYNLPELSRISDKFNHMAEVLLKSKEENRFLTQRSLAIQEDERRYLAHELHDELGQTISAIKAIAVSIGQQKEKETHIVEDDVKTIVSFSNHIYDVARNMIHRLRPAILDELGLVAALQDLIDNWNERNEERFCEFTFKNIPENLNDSINISFFRIVQESLTNVVKHSNAATVKINLFMNENNDEPALELSIEDDGDGFNSESSEWGLGLLGMRERIEALNGNIGITSELKHGVLIKIRVPLSKEVNVDE